MDNKFEQCNNCENGMTCSVVKAMYIKDENCFNDIKEIKFVTNNFKISEDGLNDIKECRIFKNLVETERNEIKSKKCPYNSKHCKFFQSYRDGTCELISKKGKIKASEYNNIPQNCIFIGIHKDNLVWDAGLEPIEKILNKETFELLNKRHEEQVKENKHPYEDIVGYKVDNIDLFDEYYFKGFDIVKIDDLTFRIKKNGITKVYSANTAIFNSVEEINEFFKGKMVYYHSCYMEKFIKKEHYEVIFSDDLKLIDDLFEYNLKEDYTVYDDKNEQILLKDLKIGDKIKMKDESFKEVKEVNFIEDKFYWVFCVRYFKVD